ncbi:MAG: polyprenyl synthetase family protein [Anaerolineae bacterium]|nr:polyprenyl synthetase family protein [Anaerolineae bacterium]
MKRLSFLKLIDDDLRRVEALLREQPHGQHEVINVAIDHLISGGGKRIRPAMVLLSAHLCQADTERALYAAAAVEMLHTATLVHDDLIDGALMRRGVETLNANWPPAATVLTGDYVFARAAYLAAQANNIHLMQRFAETLTIICNGEIRQMFNGRKTRVSQVEYEQRIYAKTASLIAMSSEAGAILAHAGDETRAALRTYGEQVGLAFQIVDDVLDFAADEQTLGKPVGSDLRQGLITLPLLVCLEQNPDHPLLNGVLQPDPPADVVEAAIRLVADPACIDAAMDVAQAYAARAKVALGILPDDPYRQALLDLADFVVRRRF